MKTSTPTSVTAAALLALAACHAAFAQPARALQDPTRPPAAALSVPADAPKGSAGPQLQSVLLDRGGASAGGRVAVIDGESVRVGDNFRGARVVRIADNEVELLRGRERQMLRLYAPAAGNGMTRVDPSARRLAKGDE